MWVLYSLFFAIWASIYTFLVKRLTGKIEPLPLLFILFLFYVPSTFILLMVTGGIPHVTRNFYIFMFVAALIDVVAFTSQFNAIKKSSISLIAPIASFTPLFTTLIAVFALGEVPTFIKSIGIILIVFGAYMLNMQDIKKGILAPIKSLMKNKGVQFALFSTFLWAITPIFQKKAIFETSPQIPLYASFIGMCLVTLFLSPFAAKKAFSYRKEVPSNIKWFILFGVGGAFAQLAAYTAFSLANVGYVTTIIRLSGLFTVILGGLFLKEERIKERFIAAAIMLVGVFILVV